jgi:predicted benzoate:H+ symporter BenE
MKREDDEKLWDLLGQAPTPAVSPFFARNVLRTIRQQPVLLQSIREWFSLGRLIPAATVAVALIVAVFVARIPAKPDLANLNNSDPVAAIDPQDYEVVADLDELVASDENGLWDDNSSL